MTAPLAMTGTALAQGGPAGPIDCAATQGGAHCVFTINTSQGFGGRAIVAHGSVAFQTYASEPCDNGLTETATVAGTFPLQHDSFNATGSIGDAQFAVSGTYTPTAYPQLSGVLTGSYVYQDIIYGTVHCATPGNVSWTAAGPQIQPTVQELSAPSYTVPHRVVYRAVLRPTGTTATSFTWQMRRSYPSQWTTLGTTTKPNFYFTARLAGHFKLRIIAHGVRASPIGPPLRLVTPENQLEMIFPTWRDIVSDQAVRLFTADAWARTLDLATPTARHELGFWISLDTCSGRYAHTTTVIGLPNTDKVNIGPRPDDIPKHPPAVIGCATYMVASFHTHTPETYVLKPFCPRKVGPSTDDEDLDKMDMVPGVVFDYIANLPGSKISCGYPKHKPAKRYPSGLLRRPTPGT